MHARLTEKGKLYNESQEQRRARFSKYDDAGRRLFTPAINKDSVSSGRAVQISNNNNALNSSFSGNQAENAATVDGEDPNITPARRSGGNVGGTGGGSVAGNTAGGSSHHPLSVSNAAADEFLYQDARDREERCRLREREQQADIEAVAGAKKMNSSSLTLLRRKAVSE